MNSNYEIFKDNDFRIRPLRDRDYRGENLMGNEIQDCEISAAEARRNNIINWLRPYFLAKTKVFYAEVSESDDIGHYIRRKYRGANISVNLPNGGVVQGEVVFKFPETLVLKAADKLQFINPLYIASFS